MAITFDTLEYAQTLIDAGFTDKQARTITQSQKAVLSESTENQLATKLDILKLENRIDKESQKLRQEMQDLKSEIRQEMQDFKNEVKQEMQEIRGEMRQNVKHLEDSISSLEKHFDSTMANNMAIIRTLGIAIFVALFGVWLKLLF